MELIIASNDADRESFIHRLDGRVKTCILLAAVFVAAMLRHWYLVAGLLLSTLALFSCMRLPWSKLLRRMLIPFGIAWLVLLNLLFTQGHEVIGRVDLHFTALPVYREGLEAGFLILLRILAAVSSATLLSLSTPVPEILATLRILRLPGLIIDLAEMIYRYILLLEETSKLMRQAQLSRGGGDRSWFGQVRDLGGVAGSVMVRALERSIRIYKAMLSRGYDEDAVLPSYFSKKVPPLDFACGITAGAALLTLLLIDCFLH